jgi:hypothetical protein
VDFDLTPEQRKLKKQIISFARTELAADVDAGDREARLPAADWARCAAFGVLGWPVPEEYGGRGLDPLTTMIALESFGYGCRDNGLVFAVNNHLWGCVIYLLLHGTDEQKARFLRPMCAGRLVGAHALSEPEAGSDVLSVRTTAERHGDCSLSASRRPPCSATASGSTSPPAWPGCCPSTPRSGWSRGAPASWTGCPKAPCSPSCRRRHRWPRTYGTGSRSPRWTGPD